MYYEERIDPAPLAGRRVAVIGYGAQGRAQALNLRDSGIDVVVGLRRRSPRRVPAARDRMTMAEPADAAGGADLVMLLVPDEVQAGLYRDEVAPAMSRDARLGFAHGFAVHFGRIRPHHHCILVAPKGPGSLLRRLYREGKGLPALVAVHPETARDALKLALAYGRAIGCGRAGLVRSTFREESVSDLFGEQAVLTGGMAELARLAFETLVARGYPPEVAYIECVQEIRGLAEILFERGIAGMREVVSSPAALGGARSGRRVIGRETRRNLEHLLDDIESGGTVRWLERLDQPGKRRLRDRDRDHGIERAGRWVRSRLRWADASGEREPTATRSMTRTKNRKGTRPRGSRGKRA